MKKKYLKNFYYILLFGSLYFPIIAYLGKIKMRSLFDRELIVCIITTVIISSIVGLFVNIIGLILSRQMVKSKAKPSFTFFMPAMMGVLIYLLNLFIPINNYLLLIIAYIIFLVPIVVILNYYCIGNITKNKKDVLKSFGRVEYLQLLDKQILFDYFIVFLFVYSDNIISSFIFNPNTKILSSYINRLLINNEYNKLGNACILSFLVVGLILLILYMINYELKLRSRYEKDN